MAKNKILLDNGKQVLDPMTRYRREQKRKEKGKKKWVKEESEGDGEGEGEGDAWKDFKS